MWVPFCLPPRCVQSLSMNSLVVPQSTVHSRFVLLESAFLFILNVITTYHPKHKSRAASEAVFFFFCLTLAIKVCIPVHGYACSTGIKSKPHRQFCFPNFPALLCFDEQLVGALRVKTAVREMKKRPRRSSAVCMQTSRLQRRKKNDHYLRKLTRFEKHPVYIMLGVPHFQCLSKTAALKMSFVVHYVEIPWISPSALSEGARCCRKTGDTGHPRMSLILLRPC